MQIKTKSMQEDDLIVSNAKPDCEICDGKGVLMEGDIDDYEEVPCTCTMPDDEMDMSGATSFYDGER
jgi:hypothetical protein